MLNPLQKLPKAELHVHLDGTITPAIVHELSQQKNLTISSHIFNQAGTQYQWKDFSDFHTIFEESFKIIQNKKDFQYITYAYLKSLAEQNALYAELIVSPYHANLNNISYSDMLEGLVAGIDEARKDFNIEARILMVFMRHYGPLQAYKIAEQIVGELHPYVVGVNLVGDIKQYQVAEFAKVFEVTRNAGLGASCHAGELEGGPIEIWQAIDYLGATRVSHGVRCIEDKKLMDELIKRETVLEICPTSNVILKMYPGYELHPFKQIHQAGIKTTLNTDDPAFFNTTLTEEYAIGQKYYGLTEQDLMQSTVTAINASFISAVEKESILKKICGDLPRAV